MTSGGHAGFAGWERLCEELVASPGGAGCIVSRVVGDVLIQVAEHTPDGRLLQLGRGFLVSDFPATREVLETGRSKAVRTDDPGADPAELSVLDELGFGSVLMLALRPGEGGAWGLVELYREAAGRFGPDEIREAEETVRRAAA